MAITESGTRRLRRRVWVSEDLTARFSKIIRNFAEDKRKWKMGETPQEHKFHRMTTEPVPKLICQLALPTIISMMVTSFYVMADTYFVGQIDTQSTAAVGISFAVMSIVQAFGFFFGHGSGSFISRKLGSQEYGSAERMAATGFFLSFGCGTAILLLGQLFLEEICLSLGSTPTILPYSIDYLGTVLMGAPFIASSLTMNNQMRFQANASYAMVGIASGALLNIVLDPLFIFGLDMGVRGAGMATVASQACSFCVLLFMTRRGGNIRIRLRNFRPSVPLLKEIAYGGSPSLCRQGLSSVATILLNTAAGLYGDAAIAAMSIVTRICLFINSFIVGFGQGFQPVCGFNYGARLYPRVLKGFWFCVRSEALFLGCMAVLGTIFAPEIVGWFRKGDPEVIAIGTEALRWQMIPITLSAWTVSCNMTLQTIRQPVRAVVLAAARQGLFFIPLIVILPRHFGLKGVEMCQAISDACSFLLAIPMMLPTLRELNRIRK